MARIPRITQSIFASAAANNGVFGSAQAGTKVTTTNIATIMGLAAWTQGWLSAVMGGSKFPPLEELQSSLYVHSQQVAYLLQQGLAEYDSATTYWTNNICVNPGTYDVYGSLTNSNVGNALSDTGNWTFLGNLSSLGNPSHFYSGGVSTGSAAAQAITATPGGFSLSNDGSTVVFTAGFACPGALTFAVNGTTAKSAKILSGGAYVNPAANQFVLNETVFITYNVTQGFYVITDAPTLGTVAPLNLDTTNFTSSGGNLAAGTGLLATIGGLKASNNLSDVGNATTARGNLTAAKSGANTDITSLSGGALVTTPLGVGSLIQATCSSSKAAGATTAAATLTSCYIQAGTSGGALPAGDTLAGTWQALTSYVTGSNNTTIWQRTV